MPALMDLQGSTSSRQSRGPTVVTYERVDHLFEDVREDMQTTHSLANSARTADPANPLSSATLYNALRQNLSDGLDECAAKAPLPLEIITAHIERERDLVHYWNQFGRFAENKEAFDEDDLEAFPLQAAALEDGIEYRPLQVRNTARPAGAPGMAQQQPLSRRPGNTISNFPSSGQSWQLPSALSLPGAGSLDQVQGGGIPVQHPPPPHTAFELNLPDNIQEPGATFRPYTLRNVPVTDVIPAIDPGEVARVEAKMRSGRRANSSRQIGDTLNSPVVESPMSTRAFSADGNAGYIGSYGNSPVQWNFASPANPLPNEDGFQMPGFHMPAPGPQFGVEGQFESGYIAHLPTAPAPQQAAPVPLAANPAQPPAAPARRWRRPRASRDIVTAVVGKQLTAAPSGNIPFPAVDPQGQPIDVTIVELLVFFPRYIYSSDVIQRIVNNGGNSNLIRKILNAHLRLDTPLEDNYILHVLQARMRYKGDQTATNGINYKTWTIGSNHPLPGHDVNRLDIAGLRTRFDIEGKPQVRDAHSIPFRMLADGVQTIPAQFDALNLTRCVQYAVAHPNEEWNYPFHFRDLIRHLSTILPAAGETFPVPVNINHRDRAAWGRWSR